MKKDRIIQILYIISICWYLVYLFTKEAGYMFCGSIFMIAASIMLIINNKKKG